MSAFSVDLHMHTTASDGRCTPEELVRLCAAAGLNAIAVTDHDTTAAIEEVRGCASSHGIDVVNGIEITAVHDGADVHMLGYFFDAAEPRLLDFLQSARGNREARVKAIAARLAALGLPIEVDQALVEARARSGRSVGRPQVARALVAAGHVADIREAFDKWLGHGCPAFVARTGATPSEVVAIVHHAGGIVSMAHPGRTRMDDLIGPLAAAGLDAIEVYHSDHDAATILKYRAIADAHDLLVTGGSDFHGEPARELSPGSVMLPAPDWERLQSARAGR